ncbi:hypothetical protein [Microbacterium arborescens]|nr:hypothetical protein [Microbacterium arborescens]
MNAPAAADYPTALWCRSRRGSALCTRPRGHAGLHNRLGTSQMWSDAQADPARCAGSGEPAEAAPSLPDGFPFGRGMCPVCTGFVELTDGRLESHDAFRGTTDAAEGEARAQWFNTVGWN